MRQEGVIENVTVRLTDKAEELAIFNLSDASKTLAQLRLGDRLLESGLLGPGKLVVSVSMQMPK